MTNTEPADTRPRCGEPFAEDSTIILCRLAPAHTGPHEWREGDEGYIWPNRDQPAPAPIGDDALTVEGAFDAWRAHPELLDARGVTSQTSFEAGARWADERAGRTAFMAALQEAREDANAWRNTWAQEKARADAADAEVAALHVRDDDQYRVRETLRTRAEAAERSLREVEDERDRLRAAMLEFAEWCEIPGVAQRDFTILADRLRRAATPSTDEEGR